MSDITINSVQNAVEASSNTIEVTIDNVLHSIEINPIQTTLDIDHITQTVELQSSDMLIDDSQILNYRTWSSEKIQFELDNIDVSDVDLSDYYIKSEIDSFLSGKSSVGHTHNIASVIGLQDDLDTKAEIDDFVQSLAKTYSSRYIQDLVDSKADLIHGHAISDVTNLQDVLDSKSSTGHTHDYSTVYELKNPALTAHLADTDNPHSVSASQLGVYTSVESDSLFKPIGYTPDWSEVTGKPSVYPPESHNHDPLYKPISYVPSWNEVTDKPSTFTPSAHSHVVEDVANLQTLLDGKASSTHNHNTAYLALAGGSLTGPVTFTTPRLKYGNGLLVSGLVIDSTKWYRVLSLDGNYCPNVELLIQIPLGHSAYRVRVSKGTSGNGMGWTAEIDCLGIYNYATGNIIAIRVVDGGANLPTYVDVKFNGNATKDIRLSIVSEIANTANNYATLVACTDQGTATAGVVSQLGFFDNATTIGVSKSYLNPWGILSLQHDSASLRHRYQVGTVDYVVGINSVGGSIQTRSSHPINFYTNQIKRLTLDSATATTATLYGNDTSNNITLGFEKGNPNLNTYTQKVKFQGMSVRYSYTDALIPNQLNNAISIGQDTGSSLSNALMIGDTAVTVGSATWDGSSIFQVNGASTFTSTLTGTTIQATQLNTINELVSGAISFGAVTRQMINLWSTTYGIGVQASTLYFRTGSTTAHFSFHGGGVHSDAACAPGAGGVEYMRLNNYGIYLDPANVLGGTAWYRSYGNTGWYNETYGGGIYMTDTTWVRTYNSKGLAGYYLNGSTLAGTGNRAVYSDANGTLTNTASDGRIKRNVKRLSYGLNEVLKLSPVFYNWKNSEKMGSQTEIGLIAQDVQKVIPEVVGVNSDGLLSLDYPKLVAVLINAIKELSSEREYV